MADTAFGPNAPEAVKVWSFRTWRQAIASTIAFKLFNIKSDPRSKDNVVQFLDEPQKGPGAEVNYTLIARLVGRGAQGDNELTGTEEALTPFTSTLKIDQIRHSVRVKGAMSQQRVAFNIRQESHVGLADWHAERDDTGLINQLTGNTIIDANPALGTIYTGNNPTVAPDAAHMVFANGKTSETGGGSPLASGDTFTVDLILNCIAIAHTNKYPIRPIRLNGMQLHGCLLIHPFQAKSLKKNFSTGQWGDIQKAAITGGQITKNPIFTGALGMYEGVVIHEDKRVPYGNGTEANANDEWNRLGIASVARGVFVGAQAAAYALGRAYDTPSKIKWTEELMDGNNVLRVAAAKIMGLQKARFDSQDLATITVSSFESST